MAVSEDVAKVLARSMTDETLASRLQMMIGHVSAFDLVTRNALLTEAARRLIDGSFIPSQNDVVTIMSGGRQFDVIAVNALDRMAQISPRRPQTINDGARWSSWGIMRKVDSADVEPYEED